MFSKLNALISVDSSNSELNADLKLELIHVWFIEAY